MSAGGTEDEEPAKGSGLPRLCGPFWKFPGPGCAGLGARLFHHPDVPCEGKAGEAVGHLNTKQTKSIRSESRSVVGYSWEWKHCNRHKKTFHGLEMFYILILVMVTWIYALIKMQ